MGVEFHITRAAFWADNEEQQITQEEWLTLVADDDELTLAPQNGETCALWAGPSAYDEPWLEWSCGNIMTKWPDPQLYRKMLAIAQQLHAQVMDDDGTLYLTENDWHYEPK